MPVVVSFADRLVSKIMDKQSHVVVGLDPYPDLIPGEIRGESSPAKLDREGWAGVFRSFFLQLLPEIAESAVAVKPQIAFFERLGAPGLQVYEELVGKAAELGLLVIGDVKRGDIGSTAEAYADAHLDVLGADAVTVNPYFGTDGMEPFLTRVRDRGKGVFVLVRTSNPSAGEIQDVEVGSGGTLYSHVAGLVRRWGEGTLGAVSYTHLRAHETKANLVCRLLLEKKKKNKKKTNNQKKTKTIKNKIKKQKTIKHKKK